jgi:putative ABC transport system permease protein
MTLWTLIRRSLHFHARAHLGVLLGATVGSAVLIGALLVGDSVRASLREMALVRLGKVDFAMVTGDRLFSERHGRDPSAIHRAAPLLLLPGTVSTGDNSARANRVQIAGVDADFWKLASAAPPFAEIPRGSVVLNRPLAEQLHAKTGDSVVVRATKVSHLSRDAPLAPQEDSSVALRLNVHAIVSDEQFGRFSLQANQVAPFNAFVRLDELQARAGTTNKVNVALWQGSQTPARSPFLESIRPTMSRYGFMDKPRLIPVLRFGHVSALQSHLSKTWSLADAELELRELSGQGGLELRTSRVFLDSPVVEAALKTTPDAQLIQTYFVNELRVGERAVPYSMVTGAGAPLVPADMKDDEMLINQWLADDLRARPSDSLTMTYFVVGIARKMEERTNTFRVRAVVPMELPYSDRDLMPDFPGLVEAKNCRDWDAGFPIDYDKMRQKDQKYWDDHKGTPKAFVTLAVGEKMWSNRFGTYTAVRFKNDSLTQTTNEEREGKYLSKLDFASIGLRFEAVREQALKAAEQSQDFGGLFIGFSFFLIIAALLLMALLFQFGIEQRTVEVGTLLALGFTPKQVRRLLLCEGAGLALLGSVLGTIGGIAYARVMLHGLTTIWRDAVGTSALHFHATPMTLVIGIVASVGVALFTIWLALRKQARQPARELLAGASEDYGGSSEPNRGVAPASRGLVGASRHNLGDGYAMDAGEKVSSGVNASGTRPVGGTPTGTRETRVLPGKGRGRVTLLVCVASVVLALALGGWAMVKQEAMAETFFGVGALLLIAALAGTSALLTKLNYSEAAARLALSGMGARNIARRRKRSLATVAMLACGSFLIVSIGAFRLDENQNATQRSAGTGGFALIGESTMPVHQDLNTKAGRDFYGLDEKAMLGVSLVPFRVRDGDDASCLNLNRAQKPRLLGVKPELLTERGAFTFATLADGVLKEKPWQTLERGSFYPMKGLPLATNEIAAIADEASILWALGKKIGDTLDYIDERGATFKIRLVASLANSILQGNLVIAEDEFVKRFPNESGYRMYLIDTPANRAAEISATLTKSLSDVGLELTPAPKRLAAFNAVQNTYLSTFQVLGGLGLLLGSVGLGVVVLRNVLERRGELALLLAVGFRPRALKWLVLSEHGALLLLGLASGVLAATVAVLPSLLSPATQLPYASLGLTLGAVLVSGALWTWGATVLALRGNLLEALRNE